MKFFVLTFFSFALLGSKSWALDAVCDQPNRIEYNHGFNDLKLAGGGGGSYTGWEWSALTVFANGQIQHSADVRVEWISSSNSIKPKLKLITKSKLWRDDGRTVICFVTL